MSVRDWFTIFSGWVKRAFAASQENGLTDRLVADALTLARVAMTKFADNAERREWVIALLGARGVPESLARFALEAAVQLLKQETAG